MTLPHILQNGEGNPPDADQLMEMFEYLEIQAKKGTITNDNAPAGDVGEYIQSVVGSTGFPANGVWGDLASIELTAGDWDIDAIVHFNSDGATWTGADIGISTTSGNSTTGLVVGSNRGLYRVGSTSTVITAVQLIIPTFRVPLASTTPYYLKYMANYSSGAPVAQCRFSARRRR